MSALVAALVGAAAVAAGRPPRGWNSWNSYLQWVNETQLLAQADVMERSGMRELGWEYVISDGGWYYPSDKGKSITTEVIDEYGRLIPTPDRYPSGWKAICDALHSKGFKCGFHLFRGVPARAWEESIPIEGSPENYTVRDAGWDPALVQPHGAFYDINMEHPAATQFLDSMFKLYCSWGIDFIKLDGTSSGRYNETSFRAIEAYRAAIEKHCGGREVVISLSAGGPGIPDWPDPKGNNVNDTYAARVSKWVQMTRVTPDTWDIWDDNETSCPLKTKWATIKPQTTTGPYANVSGHSGCCWGGRIVKHFEEFARFAHLADDFGLFPDGDMLQMGRVGSYPNLTADVLEQYGVPRGAAPDWKPVLNCTVFQLNELKETGMEYDIGACPRHAYLTLEEQRSLITLWSIARSPLIMGGDLTSSGADVIALLTNGEVIGINDRARHASQVRLDDRSAVWRADDAAGEGRYFAALFNLAQDKQDVVVSLGDIIGEKGTRDGDVNCNVVELWSGVRSQARGTLRTNNPLPPHGTAVYRVGNCTGRGAG